MNHMISKEKKRSNSRFNKSHFALARVQSTLSPLEILRIRKLRFLIAIIDHRSLRPLVDSESQKDTSFAVNEKNIRHIVGAYSRLSQREIALNEAEGTVGQYYVRTTESDAIYRRENSAKLLLTQFFIIFFFA